LSIDGFSLGRSDNLASGKIENQRRKVMHGFQHHQHHQAAHRAMHQQHQSMTQHHQAMLHQQQVARQQMEQAHQVAVQQHFQALLTPPPGVSRLRSFGRLVFSVLDLWLGE
jgi:hypothetical protein